MKVSFPLLLASLTAVSSGSAANSSSPASVLESFAAFADGLTSELYSGQDNECSSSMGVSMAMSLVYPAAINRTRAQLRQAFGYPKVSPSTPLLWEDVTANLTSRYIGGCHNMMGTGECFGTNPVVKISNRVFVDNDVVLNATYANLVGDFVQQLNFSSPDAGTLVNQWVNQSTNGLIDSVVEEGDLDDWIAIAINSIYLKATWNQPFNHDKTNTDLFMSSNATQAHFMNMKDRFPYSDSIPRLPGYQILQHSFSGDYATGANALSMILALPPPGTAPNATTKDILLAVPQLNPAQIALAMPKFRFETTYDDSLKKALKNMGARAVFNKNVTQNLCIQDQRCDAYIDFILQKTLIDVNEDGVEAAAVTALGLAVTSMPPPYATLFLANRPFQFFIHDRVANVVLFEGMVSNPGIVPGSVAPLAGSHYDANFWPDNFGIDATPPAVSWQRPIPPHNSTNTNSNATTGTNTTTNATTSTGVAIERRDAEPVVDKNKNPQGSSRIEEDTLSEKEKEEMVSSTAAAMVTTGFFASVLTGVISFFL